MGICYGFIEILVLTGIITLIFIGKPDSKIWAGYIPETGDDKNKISFAHGFWYLFKYVFVIHIIIGALITIYTRYFL